MNADRFWSKVDQSAGRDACWPWLGGMNQKGYGRTWTSHTDRVLAHRHAYELLVGSIPDGMTLDHLCRNRGCVNPRHLEPVTAVENVMRGESFAVTNARATHCIYGHPFDDANTGPRSAARPTRRHCRTCNLRRNREYRLRHLREGT